jgi:hypothetical protein
VPLAKWKGVLERFHENMLPRVDVRQALEKLIELFYTKEDPLADFSHE